MKHHSLSLIILSAALLQAAQAYAGNPEIDYVLTTQNDPVKPGHVLEFEATVRNLSGSNQNVTLRLYCPRLYDLPWTSVWNTRIRLR